MRKLGLLVWPLAALLGAITITMTAPSHGTIALVQNGGSASQIPS